MILFNPTGGTIRNDTTGKGYYGASRGSEIHEGLDWTLPQGVGQPVIATATGLLKRVKYPYADFFALAGIEVECSDLGYTMFYLDPLRELVGKIITAGQVVGYAQDCRIHYKEPKEGDLPHIHWQLDWINPIILF